MKIERKSEAIAQARQKDANIGNKYWNNTQSLTATKQRGT